MTSFLRLVCLAALVVSCSKGSGALKIGHVAPLTGNISHLGKDNENGARLALEDVNQRGATLAGAKVQFELVGEDDQADPKTGNIVAQRLVDAGVKGVIGHLNSGTTIPASRVYDQAGLPMISPSATNAKLTHQGFSGVFRTMANDRQQGAVLGAFAVQKLGKKIALIDDRTAYGQGLAEEVEKAVRSAGGSLVAREFTDNQSTDFLAILTKVKAAGPEVVIYAGMDAQAGPMLKQLRQVGLDTYWLTGDGGCTGEMLKLAAGALTEKSYCTQPGVPLNSMPRGKEFAARFQARFGTPVQLYAPYAYDAATALLLAMEKAGSADPAKYLPALKAIDFEGVTGRISFDAQGDLKEGAVTVYQYSSGKWQPVP